MGAGCLMDIPRLSVWVVSDCQLRTAELQAANLDGNWLISGMRFVDAAYHYNRTDKPELLLEAHRANLGYFDFLPAGWECTLIKFADGRGHLRKERFDYYYFQGAASRVWVPIAANRFIGSLRPQVVLLHGLIFPQQVLMLRPSLPRNTRIIVQHHAELPGDGVMRRLQRVANKYVDAYLFAAEALAAPWIEHGIIEKEKVFQVMEGSADLPQLDKHAARHHLKLPGGPLFLWVGSLSVRKDPLTVLRAFAKYLVQQPLAKLYMIFQQNDLLQAVQEMIMSDPLLRASVMLKGKMEKKDLAYWYNAADFFISASHSEGSGYALIEAMSCGCVPVVTDIPSFRQITDAGRVALLFQPGNADSLLEALCRLDGLQVKQLSARVKEQFEKELSFKAIARQLCRVCERLNVE